MRRRLYQPVTYDYQPDCWKLLQTGKNSLLLTADVRTLQVDYGNNRGSKWKHQSNFLDELDCFLREIVGRNESYRNLKASQRLKDLELKLPRFVEKMEKKFDDKVMVQLNNRDHELEKLRNMLESQQRNLKYDRKENEDLSLGRKSNRKSSGQKQRLAHQSQKGSVCSLFESNKKIVTSVLQQQKSANKGKKLLRKFRIAGYVVFFSLFLPKYTQLFTKKRFDKHKKLFYSNTVDQYEQYSSQMQLLLVDINFLEALPEPSESQEVKSSHQSSSSSSEASHITINVEVEYLNTLSIKLFAQLNSLLTNNKMATEIDTMSKMHLYGSFPINRIYLSQEISHITYHPQKLYQQVTKQHSKGLVAGYIIIKAIVFDCLLIIGKSGEWVKMMVEANKLSDKDVGRVTMLGHQLFIVGLLVYETCVKYIEQQVGKKIGNFGTIELENLPMPMSDMDFEDDEDIATKQLKKKTANQLIKYSKKETLFSAKRQHGHSKDSNKKEQYIKNLKPFDSVIADVRKELPNNADLDQKIAQFIDLLFEAVLASRRKYYTQIKEEVLKQNKNIIRSTKKPEKQFKMPGQNKANLNALTQFTKTYGRMT